MVEDSLASPSAFWTATWRSYLVILCLEIGDRTFFIAALLAGKHPGITVFVGAFGASSGFCIPRAPADARPQARCL